MTDPTPQTVDRIARAIYDSDVEAGYTAWWDFIVDDPASDPDIFDAYRSAARAALAAMPQPIGYGIRVESAGTQWLDESLFTTQEAATAEATRSGYDPYDERDVTVVALIPVEDQ